ncbi:hypothetical protein HYX00_02145 [Candidatus Woesearchaeota archaeon]|nr:hypothetical protein [Candidatus Woesearchaeota archaeon]
MPIKDLPYKKLEPLIKKYLDTNENEKTKLLIKELSVIKKRRFLTKKELEKICKWKAPRTINIIKKNSGKDVMTITKKAFSTKSERKKIELLTSLRGVSIPMASSILMLTNPKRYGVIDKRVWELLFNIGTMKKNPKGINFDFKQWYHYLIVIRYFSKKFRVKARDIERTLFFVHKKYQKGNLYS